ncbi:MAG: hypothetical protein KDA32_06060 [Phycisphaerales bacterium]|nr:hypothetical protein [Phycisphaerales bacterium]
MPRDKAGWDAAEASPSPLRDKPGYEQARHTVVERFEDLSRQFVKAATPITRDKADVLIRELYVDYGNPLINFGSQDFVLSIVGELAPLGEERVPADGRAALARGLAAYIKRGGGRSDPRMQAETGRTLAALAPSDPEALRLSDELLLDAWAWTEAIQSPLMRQIVGRHCAAAWGDSFWMDYADADMPSGFPASPPDAYLKAIAALRDLLACPDLGQKEGARLFRNATKLCSIHLDQAELIEDLQCRLLLAFRLLLHRDDTSGEIVERIGRELVRMLRESPPSAGRLWTAWRDAFGAMGQSRATPALLRELDRFASQPELPAATKEEASAMLAEWNAPR